MFHKHTGTVYIYIFGYRMCDSNPQIGREQKKSM